MPANRVRVQPTPIEVPDDDPFKHDLLGRKEFAETLASTLGAIAGPGVFAIDGGWGTGKTTFVAMFSQHLRNEGFRVVNINAWETDYAESPLAALVSSLTDVADEATRKAFKETAVRLLKVVAPPAIRIATSGLLNLDPAFEKGAGDALAKFAENGLARFEEHAKSMATFKGRLTELAGKDEEKPLVVVVDELDRCRPTYAVEMLETIKHAFDVDRLLFVLAMNRKQLDQSAETLYGKFIDPETYFKRFFDVELVLPEPNREDLVRTMLQARGFRPNDLVADMLALFIAATGHKIRTMERTLDQYAMLHGTLDSGTRDGWWWIPATVFILRLADEEGYHAFVGNQMSDDELADRLFGATSQMTSLRAKSEGHLIEAALIAACDDWQYVARGGSRLSSLLARYLGVSPERDGTEVSNRAAEVVKRSEKMADTALLRGRPFWGIVERVERFEVVARQMR